MRSGREQEIDHLYRRAGFGASQEEVEAYTNLSFASYAASVARLLGYSDIPDDVDSLIGRPGYVGVTGRSGNGFQPATNILDARQRWLFRMVHTKRPLQEKMALFWHNHFATAYTKVAGDIGDGGFATRMLAAKPDEEASRTKGQLELFREHALGNFRDLLIAVAKDPAMLVWLDGRTNVRARPQENFARELMELFTMGVGRFEETDVYAGARVFTGWNLALANRNTPQARYEFFYNAAQHDTTAKDFTFPIYADGRRTIPARSAGEGMQDGIDFINAVARHPATGPTAGAQALRVLRQRSGRARRRAHRGARRIYYATNYEIEPDGAGRAALAAVQGSVELLQALRLAGRVRRAGAEGGRLDRLLGQRRAEPADQHGTAAVRAARRQRLGARARLVLERRDAGAHELRRARSPPTSGSTCAISHAARSTRPRAWCRTCSIG